MTIATEPPPTGPRVTRHESGDRKDHSQLSWTARRWARRISDATTELTGPARMRPDFLIVGAQRCGTTTMFKALVSTRRGAPLLRKGIHYFDKDYARGDRWYRSHFPLRGHRPASRRLGGSRSDRRVEPVLHVPPARAAPDRRRAAGCQLVVLLRDPVVRAYSAHSTSGPRVRGPRLRRAVAAEPDRIAGRAGAAAGRPRVPTASTGSTTRT